MKICLSCAQGGHFDEMVIISKACENQENFFVTVKEETTKCLIGKNSVYFVRKWPKPLNLTYLNIINKILLIGYYIYINFPSLYIIIKERPDLIIGCGGQATISLFYIGKIFGCKLIYVESLARIYDISVTGRIIKPITDIFLVQWEELANIHKKTSYWGQII